MAPLKKTLTLTTMDNFTDATKPAKMQFTARNKFIARSITQIALVKATRGILFIEKGSNQGLLFMEKGSCESSMTVHLKKKHLKWWWYQSQRVKSLKRARVRPEIKLLTLPRRYVTSRNALM